MAELQHKTPRKPRRTNLRRLPGWHRTGEIFYAVGFLTEYWLICLGRKAAAAAHAARDASLYLIWLLLAPVLELGQAFCTALAGPHPLRQLVPWLAPCAAGVLYGHGFRFFGVQVLGVICVAAWVLVSMTVIFTIIKKTIGLRVTEKEEIDGLDIHEHGLASAYSGFSISDPTYAEMSINENTDLGEDDITKASEAKINAAVKVVKEEPLPADLDSGMHKVVMIVQLAKFEALKVAMNAVGVTGMTVTQVMGCGLQKGSGEKYRGAEVDATLIPKVKVEVVVSKIPVDKIIDTATKVLYTGHIGDGKIFVYNVAKVVKVRTGEVNYAALQDVE